MFYSMVFIRNNYGHHTIRALRCKGFKTINAAIKAIQNKGLEGYVKKLGINKPVWNNIQ
jgi:hypothetical protein